MSRSNPSAHTPNPAVRWFEWNGEAGVVRYYDKTEKKNVDIGNDFKFMLLDQLGCIQGWHDASDSGIYSNEVRDTRQEVLVVKAFKGGTLAEGIYQHIKDRVTSKAVGGQFVANCYIAFKNGGSSLAIGSLRFKGAALGAWMAFCKDHRADLYKKAIRIHGYTEGKKGKIVFRVPVLEVKDLSPETDAAALALDKELQAFLDGYFKRTKVEQAREQSHVSDEEVSDNSDSAGEFHEDEPLLPVLTDDDIPF